MGTNNQAAQSLLKKDYKTRDGLNEANLSFSIDIITTTRSLPALYIMCSRTLPILHRLSLQESLDPPHSALILFPLNLLQNVSIPLTLSPLSAIFFKYESFSFSLMWQMGSCSICSNKMAIDTKMHSAGLLPCVVAIAIPMWSRQLSTTPTACNTLSFFTFITSFLILQRRLPLSCPVI